MKLKSLIIMSTKDDLCFLAQQFDFFSDIIFLFETGKRTHRHIFMFWITDYNFFQSSQQFLLHCIQQESRHESPTNGSTFLPGF